MKRLALALCAVLLAACDSAPGTPAGKTGGRAEGEVLGGTISDDMIALEQLTSRAPLAPRAGPSASEVDAQQPQVAGEMAPADAPAASPVENAPAAPAADQ